MIANSILNQFIIPEYHMGVYHKGCDNANDINSIFDVSHDYVKKVVPERKHCFSTNVIFLIFKYFLLKKNVSSWELGSNSLLISRDFKNCKYLHWLIDNCYHVTIIFISGYVEIILFN